MADLDLAKELFVKGLGYLERGDFSNAEKLFTETLAQAPRSVPTLANLAFAQYQQKKYIEAEKTATTLIGIDGRNVEAFSMLSNCLGQRDKYEEGAEACRTVIAIDPTIAEAHHNLGIFLNSLGQFDDAARSILRAIQIKPESGDAFLDLGNSFNKLRRYDEALAAYDKALSLQPDLAAAVLGRGNVFYNLKRYDAALAAYDKALLLQPDLVEALRGRGNVLVDLKRHDEAFTAYDKAFMLKPDLSGIEGSRLHPKLHSCDWSDFEKESGSLIASIAHKREATDPFVLLSLELSAHQQFEYATFWASKKYPASTPSLWKGQVHRHGKIRVGYLSSDFRNHPVSYLMAGVFEEHDRQRFETFAMSAGPDDGSPIRDRLKDAFDEFIDVSNKSDRDIADQVRALNIDVLVDMMGYTNGARTSVFAQRAAPVQVNYLGYAGTMGADYFDYLIADRTLIPPSQQIHYSEKIVYLPHSYMPHDPKGRHIADTPIKRSDFGLPDNQFIFCCFNNAYKLNLNIFQSWMRILRATGGSVLWLSELPKTAQANLKKGQALAAGVNPNCLAFAKRLASSADHLARHRLADLFLDTLPFNAHTTASDALWAGLPVLTHIGETFAGRVAASLLNALDLPELITRSHGEYESLAIELAQNRDKLAGIKQKLAKQRVTTPLFKTRLFTRHIERAYEAMVRQVGGPPDHIEIKASDDA